MSSHHSDQMSQMSQISGIAPLRCSLMKVNRNPIIAPLRGSLPKGVKDGIKQAQRKPEGLLGAPRRLVKYTKDGPWVR